jgi:hypothetical protein
MMFGGWMIAVSVGGRGGGLRAPRPSTDIEESPNTPAQCTANRAACGKVVVANGDEVEQWLVRRRLLATARPTEASAPDVV